MNDDAYMSTMGVGSNNSHWSQTNDMHFEDHEFEVDEDGEGIVEHRKEVEATTPMKKTLCYIKLGWTCRGIHPLEVIKVEMLIGSG